MQISDGLQRFVAHPRRWLIVIIGTIILGLGKILPLVEEYKGLSDRYTELTGELARVEAESATLPRFEQRVDSLKVQLANLEEKAVAGENVNTFRAKVVEIVREAGCQVRRVNAGEVQSRVWLKDDSPLEKGRRAKKSDETKFVLQSQPFQLTVTGSMPQLTQLLARINELDKISHTRHLMVRPTGRDGVELEMQLELVFFDLQKKSGNSPI